MKLASMIIGILSGLGLLTYGLVAMFVGDVVSAGGGDGGFIKFMGIAIPVTALVGAGLVLQKPILGASLMILSGVAIIGWIGYSNITLYLAMPMVIAGVLGFAGSRRVKDETSNNATRPF